MPAYRYVIIGTGVAAQAAIEAIRQRDPWEDILVIGEEREGYYSRPGLAYYISGEIPEEQLFPFSEDRYKKIGVRRLQARAVAIHPDTRQVLLHNQEVITYDRLLLATGAWAARLPAPGADLPGVIKLDNLADARHLLKLARRGATGIVVGGGITAVEIAEALHNRGVQTHYLLRGDRYWGSVLDESESRIIEKRLKDRGLQIHTHCSISQVLGNKRVSSVRLSDGSELRCDVLAVAIGVLPRKELAQAAGLSVDRGILVDETLQTSQAGIYAAGDVAQVYDPLTGQAGLDSLWNPARQQGKVAGWNMAGDHQVYRKPPPVNVTRLADIPTTIIGTVGKLPDQDLQAIARGDSESWHFLDQASTAQSTWEVNRLRVMVGKHTLVGAVIMGDQSLSQPLQRLINAQVDITPVREQLLQPGAPVAEILSSFAASVEQQR